MMRVVLGGAVVLGIGAVMQPAQAACSVPGPLITSGRVPLVSTGCTGDSGCYGAPTSSSTLDGFFWGQTGADGARNAGVDSGGFLIDSWTYSPEPFGRYYYHVFLSDWNNPVSWDSLGIDGCISDITPATPSDECMCIGLTDQWDGQGYFAILSAESDAEGNFSFFDGVDTFVQLGLIPRPVVTNSTRDPATGDLTFTIAVPTPLGGPGDYRSPLCDCAIGFRVYEQVVAAGSPPPEDRRACTQETLFRSTGQSIPPNDPDFIAACRAAGFGWVPALDPSGATQSFVPFGDQNAAAAVKVPCGDPGMDDNVYLATAIGTHEGPGQIQFTHVSRNSFQVRCSQYTLADPHRPRNPEAPSQSAPGRFSRGARER